MALFGSYIRVLSWFAVDEDIELHNVTVFQHNVSLIKTNDNNIYGRAMFLNHLPNESGSFTMSCDARGYACFGFRNIHTTDSRHYCHSNGHTFTTTGTRVANMDRPIGNDILTLIYNPATGTMHGAYNREPEILLIKNITAYDPPLLPFVGLYDIGATATMVPNPRHGL